MGLFSFAGTVVAIGQSEFDNHHTRYAFIEIVEPSGRRVIVQQVWVGNQAQAALNLGAKGEFFFDKFFAARKGFVSQLWGVKTSDGLVSFDNNMRAVITFVHLGCGTVLLPFGGIGLVFLVFALPQLLKLITMFGARRRTFYGQDRAEAQRFGSNWRCGYDRAHLRRGNGCDRRWDFSGSGRVRLLCDEPSWLHEHQFQA